MANDDDANTLTVLVATDSHLGYMERDPVRGLDSFAAFEEALLLAKQQKADFVLLGGDLFHENKPSRRTLYRTIDILRRHCMGADPIKFQVVSDQKKNFKGPFPTVNFEDAFFSVALPILSIHGNHDDPTRDSGMESLAAMDLLHVMNLVNYFGKAEQVDDVEVNPVLLRKGYTRLALYGLGSMRDERLNRMWNSKKVKFVKPEGGSGNKQQEQDFFNLFVLHQNRDAGRGKKNCVHESMIPEWMDLVVWGHEHECKIDEGPQESMVGSFRVVQPGSSVATSLVEGEAKPKMVGLLKVKGDKFLFEGIPLTQVRAFRAQEICLGDIEALDPLAPGADEAVTQLLTQRIQTIVADLREEVEGVPAPLPKQVYKLQHKERVLVRLRVEHTGFNTVNTQRFGSAFVEEVANPSDLLLFHKKRITGAAAGAAAAGKGGSKLARGGGLTVPLRPDALEHDDVCVEDLVIENLQSTTAKMNLLLEEPMNLALEDYVKKSEAQAIQELVQQTVNVELKRLKGSEAQTEAEVKHAISKAEGDRRAAAPSKPKRVPKAKAAKAAAEADGGSSAAAAAGGSSSTARSNNDDDGLEDSEDDDGGASSKGRGKRPAAAAAAPKKRGAAAEKPVKRGGKGSIEGHFSRVSSAASASSSAAGAAASSDADSDVQEMAPMAPPPPKPRGRAATASSSSGGASSNTAKRRLKKGVVSEVVTLDSDDAIEDDEPAAGKGKGKAAPRRSTRPAAQQRKRPAANTGSDDDESLNGDSEEEAEEEDDDEEDDEEESNGGGRGKGRKKAAPAKRAAAGDGGAARKRRRVPAEAEATPAAEQDLSEVVDTWGSVM